MRHLDLGRRECWGLHGPKWSGKRKANQVLPNHEAPAPHLERGVMVPASWSRFMALISPLLWKQQAQGVGAR
jgi:hypothetical protein